MVDVNQKPQEEDIDVNQVLLNEIKDLKKQIRKLSDKIDNEKNKIHIPESLRSVSTDTDTSTSIGSIENFNNFTPRALQLALENGLSDKNIKGSGVGGKIRVSDIQKYITQVKKEMECSGINLSGNSCKSKGKIEYEGKYYCMRHFKQAEKEDKKTKERQEKQKVEQTKINTFSEESNDRLLKKLEQLDLLAKEEASAKESEHEDDDIQDGEEIPFEDYEGESDHSEIPDEEFSDENSDSDSNSDIED